MSIKRFTKRTTRDSQTLNIPLYKTATGNRTFYFLTVKLWNSLDSTLKLKPTLKDFKRCLKRSPMSEFLETIDFFFTFVIFMYLFTYYSMFDISRRSGASKTYLCSIMDHSTLIQTPVLGDIQLLASTRSSPFTCRIEECLNCILLTRN